MRLRAIVILSIGLIISVGMMHTPLPVLGASEPEAGSSYVPSQEVIGNWSVLWDTTQDDLGYDVVADSSGNVYVSGVSGSSLVLLKYSKYGILLWNRTWGSGRSGYENALTIGPGGYVYVVSSYLSPLTNKSDAVLLKYSQTGTIEWNATWGGVGNEFGRGIAVGPDGHIYITGGTNSSGAGGYDMFVAKFNSFGSSLWSTTWGYALDQEAYDIILDDVGIMYLAGRGYPVGGPDQDAYVVALESDGSEIWNYNWGEFPGFQEARAIDRHENGNLAVGGYTELPETLPLESLDGYFILEFNVTGHLIFVDHDYPSPDECGATRGNDIIYLPPDDIQIVGNSEIGWMSYTREGRYGAGTGGYSTIGGNLQGVCKTTVGELFYVGYASSRATSKFITLDKNLLSESYQQSPEPERLWAYTGNGVIKPLIAADLDADGTKEVICAFRTSQAEWIEALSNGSLQWTFSLPVGWTVKLAIPASLDAQNGEELIVQLQKLQANTESVIGFSSNAVLLWNVTRDAGFKDMLVGDLDGDGLDETIAVTSGSLVLWNSSGAEVWSVASPPGSTRRIHMPADFDGDELPDLITSITNTSASPSRSNCTVINYEGTVLVDFPLLSREEGQAHVQAGEPADLIMASFSSDADPGFFYSTLVDGIHLSQYVVNASGTGILWHSPFKAYQNATDYSAAKTLVLDIDDDGFCELIHRNATGAACAIDMAGVVLWFGYIHSRSWHNLAKYSVVSVADVDNDGVVEVLSALDDYAHILHVANGTLETAFDVYPYDIAFLDDIVGNPKYEVIANWTWELVVFSLEPLNRTTTTDGQQGGYIEYDFWLAIATSASICTALVVSSELWIRRRGRS